ncbi:cytochrome P450 [Coprinopsis marcescibilis]|uniref:Cytochrome P450 n=1 Tax=Coprinopsis marcescibilis TaxID=230819 RepID=A0A5C3LAR6_COPMA|nr:cytochrome P450 [Coprinopsis marcescibilis]
MGAAADPVITLLLLVLPVVSLAYWGSKRRRANLPLPPQPPGWPIIGNLLSLPRTRAWERFTKWGQELNSDIVYLNFCGAGIVILNTFEVAMDLLDKRSGIYSDRPRAVLIDEMVGFGYMLSRLKYGDRWRERRRLFHEHLRPSKSSVYEPKILDQVRRTMVQLANRPPDKIQSIFRHMSGGIALSVSYGLSIGDKDDLHIAFAEEVLGKLNSLAGPAVFVLNRFPIFRHIPSWFPGARFKRQALQVRPYADRFRELPFAAGVANLETPDATDSFISRALERMRESSEKVCLDAIKDTAAVAYVAGSETTYAGMSYWIRDMIVHPDVQSQLQNEIDSVLCGRLPEFTDLAKLPLLEASILESLRLYTIVPTGVPHASSEDDVYRGYFIPKGSTVIPNSWAMLHNEKDYPDAMVYNPSRFLRNGIIDPDVLDPRRIAFGFGRRICAGLHIANATLLMAAATVVALFEVRKVDGEEVEMGMKNGFVHHPNPYRCIFEVRNDVSGALLGQLEEEGAVIAGK